MAIMSEMSILDEETATRCGMIKGREIVRLILEQFKTYRHIDQMLQVDGMVHLEHPGDGKM